MCCYTRQSILIASKDEGANSPTYSLQEKFQHFYLAGNMEVLIANEFKCTDVTSFYDINYYSVEVRIVAVK